MYKLLRKFLFSLDPEKAHHLTLNGLWMAEKLGLCQLFVKPIMKPVSVMGLTFPNLLGIAAGLDKSGDYIDALGSLGFGFIEIGSLTPKPQDGNPKPRLFRIPAEKAILNRMGFNNKGVDYAVQQLQKIKYRGILGINIGKNKVTPNELALDDYVHVFRKIAHYASYVTINISSPNTENLRALQHGELLQNLLRGMKQEQLTLFTQQKKYIPLVVKISPDITSTELESMADIFLQEKIDGVIATNTTMTTTPTEGTGGLSGQPLMSLSTTILKKLHERLQNQIPIIGCGGIFSPEDAHIKLANGARLLQIYTGLIYQGPGLISEILSSIPV
ncbi:MAG TPA: quinone-dependent dihydroorotate dehydrogenase [Gammaproteobacteria bacterium]|jgi:dihydroorotate dehydrogenase|nr:quinone-dependent dihydroorotate dehydrogenase [Gammaproteobacteria bacterium]